MSAESLTERIMKAVGSEALLGVSTIDPADPAFIDHAAAQLLAKLRVGEDGEALAVLVDLTQDALAQTARQVALDVGLAMDSHELVASFFARTLADARRHRGQVHDFLARAAAGMHEEAEAWLSDFACTDLPADLGALDQDETSAERYTQAVRTCFHRLDTNERRLLRAADIELMRPDEIATEFAQTEAEVEAGLTRARMGLASAIATWMESGGR